MANALYPLWKQAIMENSSNSALTGTVKAALVDTDVYTYSASDQFYTAISSAVVGTPQTLTNKVYTNGIFSADDTAFTSLSGAEVEAVVLYIDTGSAATSRLVAYLDTGVTGLPFTPNGGNVTLIWDTGVNKIFKL